MATVKDLYTQEGAILSKLQTTFTAHRSDGDVEVLGTTLWHHELAAFYRAYYIDTPPAVGLVDILASLVGAQYFHDGLKIIDEHPAQFGCLTNENMRESPCIVLYVNSRMNDDDVANVQAAYASRGKTAIIRDSRFADYITAHSSPAAFVSHDSRDKDEFARPLADRLAAQLIPVWYDEYSLRIGDNLYESIERGLKVAPKVIVLLSTRFFANTSWARQEFLMAVHRHMADKIFLPVWIDVEADEVRRYDLTLAGLIAVRWPRETDPRQAATEVAAKLADAIRAQRG